MFCYQTDVIVCTTPQFPKLYGPVAENLLERSGEEREIRHDCKKKGQLEIGEVFESLAGKLQCKCLYHVLMEPRWTASGPKVKMMSQVLEVKMKTRNCWPKRMYVIIISSKL